MQNVASWVPSKFVRDGLVLQANRDPRFVSVSSRLNVDLLGQGLQTILTQHARGRLLDLGCGRVPLYELYRDLVSSVVCVDWSQSAHDLGYIDQAMDLNAPLPIQDCAFDTVILTDVLEHIAEPSKLMREIRRVLAEEGMLLGSVPFMYWEHEAPHDHHRFTQYALRKLASQSDFVVEALAPYGVGTDVLFDILAKLLESAHWRLGPTLADHAQRLGMRVRRWNVGKQINSANQAMPLGYVFALRAR